MGRVRLKSDMSAGETTVPVKRASSYNPNIIFEGQNLFHRVSNTAVLVEPTSADEPDAISHQETVTIDDDTFTLGSQTGDILLTSGTTYSYTTSNGAYIRLPDSVLPSACSGLRFIEHDFISSPTMETMMPKSEWFPGVIVSLLELENKEWSMNELGFTYHLRVYYCDIVSPSVDNAFSLWDRAEQLRDLVLEDPYVGGEAAQCTFLGMKSWAVSILAQRGIRFITSREENIGWIEMDFEVLRPEVWDKSPL